MKKITKKRLDEDNEIGKQLDCIFNKIQFLDLESQERKELREEYQKLFHQYFIINDDIRMYYRTL